MKKKLLNAFAVGAAVLALNGCDQKYEYSYEGRIGKESVKFYSKGYLDKSYSLEVIREDGKRIKYDSWNGDKVYKIIITKKDSSNVYLKNTILGEDVVKIGQKQYDDYLEKILKEKTKKGLEDIKK